MKNRSSSECLEMITRILDKYPGKFSLLKYANYHAEMYIKGSDLYHSGTGYTPSEAIGNLLDKCEVMFDYDKTWSD